VTGTGPAPRRTPVRPVRRSVLLGSLVLLVAGLVLAIEAVDLLRHPPAGGEPAVAEADADPRLEIECPDLDILPAVTDVTSNDLYDCPLAFDGRAVSYTGEVVGAVLRRRGHAWVHLNDDVYAGVRGPLPAHRDYQGGNGGVGVRIPSTLAADIERVGGPAGRGDLLRIEGVFHRVHPGSREAAVIVATSGSVAAPGQPFVDPILPDRAVAALLLGTLALGLAISERIVARRRR
jgi:hypothetical protein